MGKGREGAFKWQWCETELDEQAEAVTVVGPRAPETGLGLQPEHELRPFRHTLSTRADPLGARTWLSQSRGQARKGQAADPCLNCLRTSGGPHLC